MDGCSIVLLAALVVGAGVVAWRNLSDRLRQTQLQLEDLKLDFHVLRQAVAPRSSPPEASVSPTEPDQVAAEPSPASPPPATVPSSALPAQPAEPEIEDQVQTRPEALEAPPDPKASRLSVLQIDWERWIGVRGAAVLGGIVLALAALLFLKYSIEHGLIPPIVRVIAGVIGGVGAIGGAEALRKRGYDTTANALAGSGVVILYASFWAASRLYELVPVILAIGLMTLVTVACGALAWRHRSLVIAILGLAGGFATPLLLDASRDNPIGLFAYILLLDTGLLVLARRGRWPILGILGLLATVFYQALWILFDMEPERQWLGLLILGAFAALFASTSTRPRSGELDEDTRIWRVTQYASVLLPFLFTLYFAGDAALGTHLWAVAGLLLLLSLAADWISRTQASPALGLGAAAADVAVVLVWISRTKFDSTLSWEVVAIASILTLAFHLFGELEARRGQALEVIAARSAPALVAATGFFVLLVGASLSKVPSLWPWLVGWSLLAALLVRQAYLPGRGHRQILAAGLLGSGFALFFGVHGTTFALPPAGLYFGLVLAASVVFQLLAQARQRPAERALAEWAAALLPAIALVGLLVESMEPTLSAGLYHLTTIALAILLVLVGTRLPEGRLLFASMVLLACTHFFWTLHYANLAVEPHTILLAMGAQIGALSLFVVWPFITAKRLASDRWAWYAAALAPPAWFFSLKYLFESRFGGAAIGILPLGLGALSLTAAYQLTRVLRSDDPRRKSGLAWFSAVALGFLSLAIPLQLDHEWITIGWALEGLAVILLWKHLDHPGLKYFGLALLSAVTVRLIANPALLGYHSQTAWPVFNWLMYTYLVPAGALLGSAAVLRQLECDRALDFEEAAYARGYPLAAIGCGVAAILVLFVWINLTIFDAFSPGMALTISFDRLPARDLTLSLAWAVYALILLAAGMARRSQGLRWISLAFLVLTIGKVFLYDLGELKDLYRVASLMGLAISLILVSLAYQRFVFRPQSEDSE